MAGHLASRVHSGCYVRHGLRPGAACSQATKGVRRLPAISAGQTPSHGRCPEPDLNRHAPEGQRGLSSPCLHSTIRAWRASPRWYMTLSGDVPRSAEQWRDVVLFYWLFEGPSAQHGRHSHLPGRDVGHQDPQSGMTETRLPGTALRAMGPPPAGQRPHRRLLLQDGLRRPRGHGHTRVTRITAPPSGCDAPRGLSARSYGISRSSDTVVRLHSRARGERGAAPGPARPSLCVIFGSGCVRCTGTGSAYDRLRVSVIPEEDESPLRCDSSGPPERARGLTTGSGSAPTME